MRAVLASSNQGKAQEFDRLLRPFLQIDGLPSGVSLPPETGTTFAANARLKAEAVARELEGTVGVLADDSGLQVDALGGEPGVLSARYAGQEATDEQNVARLLSELGDSTDRSARFVCALCMILPTSLGGGMAPMVVEVEERSEGEITTSPRGDKGFGYDPVFRPVGWRLSLAEAEPGDKDAVSHRGAAARELLSRLLEIAPSLAEVGDRHGA